MLQHLAYGVSHLVEYRSIDATNIPYTEHFDIVLFKSVLGGIGSCGGKPLQAKAITEMYKALKRGGELLFAENLVATPVHRMLRQRCVKWGGKWRYVSLNEMAEFLSPFSRVRLLTTGFSAAFGRSEAARNWLGLLDKVVFDHLVPTSWKYIIAGVACKET